MRTMMDRDQKQSGTGWRGPENDELDDREFDAGLAKYAAVEPRAGLEERVLANLRAERTRVADQAWWRWGLAGALAAVVVVAVALGSRSGRPSRPVIANHPPVTRQRPPDPEKQAASRDGNAVHPREHESIHRTNAHPSHSAVVAAAHPKLDQFPSPQPLSEQEKILKNYVTRYPEHAVLIARAASEALRRDELEETKALPSGDQATDSDERNNDTTER